MGKKSKRNLEEKVIVAEKSVLELREELRESEKKGRDDVTRRRGSGLYRRVQCGGK